MAGRCSSGKSFKLLPPYDMCFMHINVSGRLILLFNKLIDLLTDAIFKAKLHQIRFLLAGEAYRAPQTS